MEGDFEHHPLADQFNRLTPEQVIDAVEVGGRRCTGRFAALNSYENRVYQLELGTLLHWQREIQDLREQIARVDVMAE